jgi:hypothetical protein
MVASCMQFGIAWLLGSRGYRFEVKRTSLLWEGKTHGVLVEIRPAVPLKPLAFSGVSTLENLYGNGYFPRTLREEERHPMGP